MRKNRAGAGCGAGGEKLAGAFRVYEAAARARSSFWIARRKRGEGPSMRCGQTKGGTDAEKTRPFYRRLLQERRDMFRNAGIRRD